MTKNPYAGYRYSAENIGHAVRRYFIYPELPRVEALLAARGIPVTYEPIQQWCLKF